MVSSTCKAWPMCSYLSLLTFLTMHNWHNQLFICLHVCQASYIYIYIYISYVHAQTIILTVSCLLPHRHCNTKQCCNVYVVTDRIQCWTPNSVDTKQCCILSVSLSVIPSVHHTHIVSCPLFTYYNTLSDVPALSCSACYA